MCANKTGDHTAPVDVTDHHNRGIDCTGKPHIRNITSPQIDLGRAASPLDDQQISLLPQLRKTIQNMRHQTGFMRAIFACAHAAETLSLHNDLGTCIGFGLEQNRVHMNRCRATRGPRLQRLRPANLAAIGGDGRIVRHVLRFKWGNLQTLIGKIAA